MMDTLKKRIEEEGQNLGHGILKIDSFLNHQIDARLMEQIGEAIAAEFKTTQPTRILTAEVSGLIPAAMTGKAMTSDPKGKKKSKAKGKKTKTDSKNTGTDKKASETTSTKPKKAKKTKKAKKAKTTRAQSTTASDDKSGSKKKNKKKKTKKKKTKK